MESILSFAHSVNDGIGSLWNKFWTKKSGFDRNKQEIPEIVTETCDFIDQHGLLKVFPTTEGTKIEGIFRISASHEEVLKVKKLYDEGSKFFRTKNSRKES